MSKNHTIVMHFDSDDPNAVRDLVGIIRTTAPYIVDNVEIETFKKKTHNQEVAEGLKP